MYLVDLLLPHEKQSDKDDATMSKSNVSELEGRDESQDSLTEILGAGVQQLIRQAVEAELQDILALHAQSRTMAGSGTQGGSSSTP